MAFDKRENPYMDITKIISKNLDAWMNNNPALDTIQKLEDKSGVGFGTIRRTRKGEGNITVEKLASIALAFKRHPAELLIEAAGDAKAQFSVDASSVTDSTARHVAEQSPAPPFILRSPRQRNIDEIQDVLERINDSGIVAILEFSKHVARDQPLDVSKTLT
jgi:transcriptional regulator with XRE-family HTH domain